MNFSELAKRRDLLCSTEVISIPEYMFLVNVYFEIVHKESLDSVGWLL